MEEVFRQCIEEERERDRTVLLSSHILSEVEALCDRVSIIRLGKVVETGTLAEMRHLTRTSIHAELDAVPQQLSWDWPVCTSSTSRATGCTSRSTPPSSDEVLQLLTRAGVHSLTSQPPTLEELFLRHYQDEIGPTHDKHAAEVTVR